MDELFVRANVSILYDFPTLQSKAFAVFWKAFCT